MKIYSMVSYSSYSLVKDNRQEREKIDDREGKHAGPGTYDMIVRRGLVCLHLSLKSDAIPLPHSFNWSTG